MQVASRRLRQAVLACELAPGEFVREAALAERFGLGRAGIRVALTELCAAGFVSRHARQGWRIAPIDGTAIADVLDGRRRLELSLATQRLDAPAQARLGGLLGMVASVAGRSEPAALATARTAERQIREILAAGAGSSTRRWLQESWDHADRILRALDLAGQSVPPGDLNAIVAALCAGDAAAAAHAIAEDNRRFAEALAHGFVAASGRLPRQTARTARRRAVPGETRAAETRASENRPNHPSKEQL